MEDLPESTSMFDRTMAELWRIQTESVGLGNRINNVIIWKSQTER